MLILAFFITKPFLPALLTGSILAYLAYPLYERALKWLKNRNAAALIVSILLVLVITVPFILVIGIVSKQAFDTYASITQGNANQDHRLGTNFMKVLCKNEEGLACNALKYIIGFFPGRDIDYLMHVTIEKITVFIVSNVSSFLASLPSIFLNLFVMAFVVYYLFKDGGDIVKRVKNILPLKESHKNNVLKRLHEVVYAVFYGNIGIAVIQGALGAIGFAVLGVKSPLLWGFVMMLFALIPYFGTAIVWLPAALNLVFIGYLNNDSTPIIKGVVLILYGLLVISTIDNILKPKIISKNAKVHPILVLLGVLGGINLFGFLGIILGPVMLAIVITFVEIYEEEKADIEKYF